ncbi:MAG: PIG-L family deacetylase [Anaerolineales bacterium]
MSQTFESLGHFIIALAFAILSVYAHNKQMELRRTTQRARLLYRVILTVALFGCGVNVGWLAYNLSVLQAAHLLGALVHGLSYVSVLLIMMVVVVLIHFKPMIQADLHKTRRILAIGAHPDDIEIACGGTLARLRSEGHIVHGLVLTRGGRGGNPLVRQNEARNGAWILGLHELTLHDLSDTRLANEREVVRQRIEEKIQEFQPDLIFTHSANDQHEDHRVIHEATVQAGRRVNTILCYESPSVTPDFKPNLFIEIGKFLDIKIESIREHVDQARKPYMDEGYIRAQARVRGEQAKTQYAEGFEIRRALMMEGGIL